MAKRQNCAKIVSGTKGADEDVLGQALVVARLLRIDDRAQRRADQKVREVAAGEGPERIAISKTLTMPFRLEVIPPPLAVVVDSRRLDAKISMVSEPSFSIIRKAARNLF